MTIHTLAGLPRSGTTLLANTLTQHPDVYVSGTSALYNCVEGVVSALTDSAEVQADLANVPGSYERYLESLRGFASGWYSHRPESNIVDKSRGWLMQPILLTQIDPDSKMIVCVRDPRDVIASIERQHRKTAAFHSPLARTIAESTEVLMRPDGMVGGACRFVEDLLRRKLDIIFVRYETFVVQPEVVLSKIIKTMGLDEFTFDTDNVENVATDLDAITRNKYPHDGSGRIAPSGKTWHDVLDDELASRTAASYPLFMSTFDYT